MANKQEVVLSKIEDVAKAYEDSHLELVQLWGKWLRVFCNIACAISVSEMLNSEAMTVLQTLYSRPQLDAIMMEIDAYLVPFEDVIQHTITDMIEKINREGDAAEDKARWSDGE